MPGGAIYFANDSSAGAALNITDSTIAGNTITCCENGAGIAFENGGVGTLTIDGSTLSGNTAATNSPGTGHGGALYFHGATATITNSTSQATQPPRRRFVSRDGTATLPTTRSPTTVSRRLA